MAEQAQIVKGMMIYFVHMHTYVSTLYICIQCLLMLTFWWQSKHRSWTVWPSAIYIHTYPCAYACIHRRIFADFPQHDSAVLLYVHVVVSVYILPMLQFFNSLSVFFQFFTLVESRSMSCQGRASEALRNRSFVIIGERNSYTCTSSYLCMYCSFVTHIQFLACLFSFCFCTSWK